ncbi:MAG: sigma-54 dependent transcriptional regulator [Syntrophales bacterium]
MNSLPSVTGKILIIDDDKILTDMLGDLVRHMGHDVQIVHTLEEGLEHVNRSSFDAVFLDVRMPDGSGLDVISRIKQSASAPEVIIITASGDPQGAERAIKSGAWDYIEKPSSIRAMTLPLARALQYREAKKMKKRPLSELKKEGIVGSSPQIRVCLDQIAEASCSDASILITGETGTGKELFALAIHHNSARKSGNFVVVDCAALSDNLVESMLFGYEKGAYTGADRSRDGLIIQADGGTLFLDEIGELPLPIQKSFLRVLQEHRFRPLGSKYEMMSDFRLVAATNKDLDQMVRNGQFRSDLLFRLRSLTIELPPLRNREGDIEELARHHLERLRATYGTGTRQFSPEFIKSLKLYDWPGNVRELLNTLEKVFASARGEPVFFSRHLPTQIRIKIAQSLIGRETSGERNLAECEPNFPKLQEYRDSAIEKAEKQYLADLLAHTGKDIKNICRISGLSRSRLYELLKKYDL